MFIIRQGSSFSPGDVVYWHQAAKPGGWHAGKFKRVITRGRWKGFCEVEVGGTLLPLRVERVAIERLRVKAS